MDKLTMNAERRQIPLSRGFEHSTASSDESRGSKAELDDMFRKVSDAHTGAQVQREGGNMSFEGKSVCGEAQGGGMCAYIDYFKFLELN